MLGFLVGIILLVAGISLVMVLYPKSIEWMGQTASSILSGLIPSFGI